MSGDMKLIDNVGRYYALNKLLQVEQYSNFWIALGRCHMNRSLTVIINEKKQSSDEPFFMAILQEAPVSRFSQHCLEDLNATLEIKYGRRPSIMLNYFGPSINYSNIHKIVGQIYRARLKGGG